MNNAVHALATFNDGAGPALYAGGNFTAAGGAPANRIARWNGTSWSPLGAGTNAPVRAPAVWDDGGGPALHAGGTFTEAGGTPARNIAKWDATGWSALGSGAFGDVSALGVFDDGSGQSSTRAAASRAPVELRPAGSRAGMAWAGPHSAAA